MFDIIRFFKFHLQIPFLHLAFHLDYFTLIIRLDRQQYLKNGRSYKFGTWHKCLAQPEFLYFTSEPSFRNWRSYLIIKLGHHRHLGNNRRHKLEQMFAILKFIKFSLWLPSLIDTTAYYGVVYPKATMRFWINYDSHKSSTILVYSIFIYFT